MTTAPTALPAGLAAKGATLAQAAARGTGWLRRMLRDPERPLVAVEVRTRSVGVVRMAREGGRKVLGAAAFLELPEGCAKLSMTQPNILDPETFKTTLRAVLERAGVLGGGKVALVLPDPVARVALVPAAEVKGNRSQMDELVRFRLRKAVPFDVREARVATVAGGARSGDPLMVGAIYQPVLEGYESACRALGLYPGVVELSGLALLNAAFAPNPPKPSTIRWYGASGSSSEAGALPCPYSASWATLIWPQAPSFPMIPTNGMRWRIALSYSMAFSPNEPSP